MFIPAQSPRLLLMLMSQHQSHPMPDEHQQQHMPAAAAFLQGFDTNQHLNSSYARPAPSSC